jgi:adenosylhomocysteine nucleosidase
MIGIIGAMEVEVELLVDELEEPTVIDRRGLRFFAGTLRHTEVVVVVGGIGTVNAAACTAVLLDAFEPTAVLCTGVAGGLSPALVGDVVIGSATISLGHGQLTVEGLTPTPTEPPLQERQNPLLFSAGPNLLAAGRAVADTHEFSSLECVPDDRTPKFLTGVIATEDAYSINGARNRRMLETYGCVAFEMEGAAIAQICHQAGVPFLAVRAISNPADEAGAAEGVYGRCKAETARSAQVVVLNLLEALPDHGTS